MTIPKKKQDILGWALTTLRKFRVSKLPYFYNLDRELYSSSTSGFWTRCDTLKSDILTSRKHTSSPSQTQVPHCFFRYYRCLLWKSGHLWRRWLRPCATSRKVAGSIPDRVIGIFRWHNSSGHVADSTCNRNEYQEYFLGEGGKGGRCVGLTSLPSSCSDCLKIWEPQPPETLRAWVCFAFCTGNHVKWSNIVWAKSRAFNVQHVDVWLLPLSFKGTNARTLH